MTIAACYPCLEGVVLGADSTTTIDERLYYNYCQKVFEFGEKGSTIGMVLWGLGTLPEVSHRTLIAETADVAKERNLTNLGEIAALWSEMFWAEYTSSFEDQLIRVRALDSKGDARSEDEELEYLNLQDAISAGSCIAGRGKDSRRPKAYQILFDPLASENPAPQELELGQPMFWGCENLIDRVTYGIDPKLYYAILSSGKWNGTPEELAGIVRKGKLNASPNLPIREAVDLIYTEIYITIQSMKFSQFSPVCGGPIEIAAITTDRPFRWVCHKSLSRAITEIERARNDFQLNA